MTASQPGTPEQTVLFSVDDRIARITLNRPAHRNAVDVAMSNCLTALWARIEADDTILAVVLDSADCGVFCAGMDLKEMAAARAAGGDLLTEMDDPFQERMRCVSKPIICALDGHFTGAGMLLAMRADMRVGLTGTFAAISEARFGRGTSWTVPLLWMMPQPILAEMMMTGERVAVELLAGHGFINHLASSAESVRARAMDLARKVAANAPLSVRAAKASLAAGMDLGCANGLVRAAELHSAVYASDDAHEGARAFAEKRPPRWAGHQEAPGRKSP